MSHSKGTLRVTVLGCGASGGVPRADGDWGVCDPANPKNQRTRCGMLLRQWRGPPGVDADATIVLIDTPPELRLQLVRERVHHLDGVILTHEHADQTHGLDDVRPFALRQRRAVPAFMDEPTAAVLGPRFSYIFDGALGYPAILSVQPLLQPPQTLAISGPGGTMRLTALRQDHGFIASLGVRCGSFGYANDVVRLPDETLTRLEGLALFVVDALREKPHPTHAHVALALEWIERLKPAQAVLTNLHIDLDYAALAATLPAGVVPAYDGLSFDLPHQIDE